MAGVEPVMRYDGLGWFGWIGLRLFNKVVIGSGQDCLEFGDLFLFASITILPVVLVDTSFILSTSPERRFRCQPID
jgi:hypothetical protein